MPLSMPSNVGFIQSSFDLEFNTQQFTSPLNRSVQRRILSGARWVATYQLPKMKREDYVEWKAFFQKLKGRANTFYAFDPDGVTPRGVATGTPKVNGASQTGTSLVTDGWTASQTGILKAGDYFTVGGELKQVTDDIDSDSSGNATITFEPALRSSPSDNAVISTSNPQCEMVLSVDILKISTDKLKLSDPIVFSAVEVFA